MGFRSGLLCSTAHFHFLGQREGEEGSWIVTAGIKSERGSQGEREHGPGVGRGCPLTPQGDEGKGSAIDHPLPRAGRLA